MSPKITIEPGDRFIDKKELRTLVLYSPHHIRRMEYAGKFPGHIRIGDNRVAWLEREVKEWLESRRLAEDAPSLTAYQVRLCRPRFEIANVTVAAESREAAKQAALATANSAKSGWRILPYDPEAYRPSVEVCLQDEQSPQSKPTSAIKDQDVHIHYLMLSADTESGEGAVLLQPWFSDEKLGELISKVASDWMSGINDCANPISARERRRK